VRRLAPLAVLALIGAACGGVPGGTTTSATPDTVVGTVPTPTTQPVETQPTETVPPEFANGDAAAGKDVFVAQCGVCHVLDDAGTTGAVGPNLDEAKPSLALAVDRVVNGMGAMPAFEGQLTTQEIADVAAYVVEATQGSG
jgi:mono/diheme cytochrome c family protein